MNGYLKMTIDPTFTHRVLEITRDKLFDKGEPNLAENFFKESFGFDNPNLIARIIRGEYVMVFNEDGTGNVMHRDEVSEAQIDAMEYLPKYYDRNALAVMLRDRVYRYRKEADELLKAIMIQDFHNIRREYSVEIGAENFTTLCDIIGSVNGEFSMNVNLTTRSIIQLWNKAKTDETAKTLLQSIIDCDAPAAHIFYICNELENQVNRHRGLMNILAYIKKYWEEDIEDFDSPRFDGRDGITAQEIQEHPDTTKYYYIFTPYMNIMNEILTNWQYVNASVEDQDVISKSYMDEKERTKETLKNHIDFIKRQEEVSNNPVKIDERPWDAGWIAPDGKVWADCGSVSNLIHINLADRIFKWMGWEGTDEDVENRDHKLERMGWMKFHNQELSFAGYIMIGNKHKITNRQKDRLVEYAKNMGYTSFYTAFKNDTIKVEEIYDMDEVEWQSSFEW